MGANKFSVESPVDGTTYYDGSYLPVEQAEERLERARAAQRSISSSSVEERATLCRGFLEHYASELEANAKQITLSMGKPLSQAKGEFGGLEERTQTMCALAADALAPTVLSKDGFQRSIVREPLGVVLDIAAWNYPLLVAVNVVVPAVLAGNSVLLKHAAQTALVGPQFERAFRRAGAPDGLVQDFMVDHDTVGRLCDRGVFDHVGFTGSVEGGRAVYSRLASRNFIACGLELGGKDAALVLDDVDLAFAVPNLVDGAFYNAGQSCCAVERIYVPESLFDQFVQMFADEVQKLRLGNPLTPETTLGPVVNSEAAQRIEEQCADALAQGAKRVVGPSQFQIPTLSPCYVAPQVFVNVSHDMLIMNEETFGPVVGIMPYRDLDEGLRLVNDSRYGLTASIWTRDLSQAANLAPAIQAGTVFANRADYVDPELPWTGTKNSGFGSTLSREGLLALTRPKSLHFRMHP